MEIYYANYVQKYNIGYTVEQGVPTHRFRREQCLFILIHMDNSFVMQEVNGIFCIFLQTLYTLPIKGEEEGKLSRLRNWVYSPYSQRFHGRESDE
jgi:hypothetical protein